MFAALSVGDNLRLGAFVQRRALGERGIAARIDAVCAHFPDLRARLREPAGNLSGGQQQMLAIGRALMSGPRLLVLNEPSLGLSPRFVAQVFALIGTLREAGVAILLAEQNARMSLALANQGAVLEMGRVVLRGPGPALLARPEVAERYLGAGRADAAQHGVRRAAGLARDLAAIIAADRGHGSPRNYADRPTL